MTEALPFFFPSLLIEGRKRASFCVPLALVQEMDVFILFPPPPAQLSEAANLNTLSLSPKRKERITLGLRLSSTTIEVLSGGITDNGDRRIEKG